MIDLSKLQEIDVGDFSTWPIWFRWVVIGLAALGVLYAGYQYFIEPERRELARMERTEKQLKDAFLSKKELAVNLPAYREQMVEIQDRFGVVLQQLPDKTEVPALLIDISQAGLSRGLKFSQFKPDKARTEDFYITLPISITVTGTYHQLAEFISDLASLPRIVTLGDMDISKKEANLEMKAQIFTYQYLEETLEQSESEKVRVRS